MTSSFHLGSMVRSVLAALLLAVTVVRGDSHSRRNAFLLDLHNGITYDEYTTVAYVNGNNICSESEENQDTTGRCTFLKNATTIMEAVVDALWAMVGEVKSEVVDCVESNATCSSENVTEYPTLVLYRNGEDVNTKTSGKWTKNDLVNWFYTETDLAPTPAQSDIPIQTTQTESSEAETMGDSDCQTGCLTCESSDDYRCTQCLEGWGQTDTYSSTCDECSTGCKDCSNEDLACYVCYEGYTRVRDVDMDTFYCVKNDNTTISKRRRSAGDTMEVKEPHDFVTLCASGCLTCLEGTNTCEVCLDGYTLIQSEEGSSICVQDIQVADDDTYIPTASLREMVGHFGKTTLGGFGVIWVYVLFAGLVLGGRYAFARKDDEESNARRRMLKEADML